MIRSRHSAFDRPIALTEPASRWLLQLTVVVGVLATSAQFGRRGADRYLAPLLGLLGLLALLRWPPLGLLALVVAAQVVPFELATGTETRLNAAVLLLPALLGLWLLRTVLQRRASFLSAPALFPLLVFGLVAVVATLAGAQPWLALASTASVAAQLGGLAICLLSASACFLAAHQLTSVRWLAAVTWLFLALGALYLGGRLMPAVGGLTSQVFQRGGDGAMFWTWLVALAFSQAAFNRRLAPVWRLGLAAAVLAALYIGLFRSRAWISGWLPALVAILVVMWVARPRLALLLTVLGGAIGASRLQPLLSQMLLVGDNEYSLSTRLEAWQILAEIVKLNPVLGLGPANYYWYTPLFPIRGYAVSFNSHNNYVDLVAQTGLLGLGCFLWFALATWWLGWRLRNQVEDGFSRAYVYGALGGLAGTLAAGAFGDWVIPFVYNIGYTGFRASLLAWVFLGGLIALGESARCSADHQAQRPSGGVLS